MHPLAQSVLNMQRNTEANRLLFPTSFAVLVWDSVLQVAEQHQTKPSATSIISFKEFYRYYQLKQFPINARRLFLVDATRHAWRDDLWVELLIIEEHDERHLGRLPLSLDDTERRISYFEWVTQVHQRDGWEVKFMDLAKVDTIKQCYTGKVPTYDDFVIVPADERWNVLFSCDLNRKETGSSFYHLPLECCPITLSYSTQDKYDEYFDLLWEKANNAADWLTSGNTDHRLENLNTYVELIGRLSI